MVSREKMKTFRQFIERMASQVDDATALDNILAFPKWEVGKEYVADERIRYNDVLYKVLQQHTSQADWTPDVAVSLYVRVSIEEFPAWIQPTGAHDSYPLNSKVSHNEKHWISTIDANTYEPGVYGWDEVA